MRIVVEAAANIVVAALGERLVTVVGAPVAIAVRQVEECLSSRREPAPCAQIPADPD